MNLAPGQPTDARSAPGVDTAALVECYGLLCADEALSVVRHDVLNRMTAVGALSYELRQRLPPLPRPAGPSGDRQGGDDGFTRARLDDLNRQVGLLTEAVGRRLAPASVSDERADVKEALAVVQNLLPIAVQSGTFPRVRVGMSARHLQVVLLAVLSNGARASQQAGRDRLALSCQLSDGRLTIQVDDSGSGLSAEGLERCFERFFTTWPGHAGLGLSVARTLVLRAGGEITAVNQPDQPAGAAGGGRVLISLAAVEAGRRGRA